jgi:hypothetical protein
MDDSERIKFGTAIAAMLEAFGQESTKSRIYGYWLGLQGLSISQVQVAVAKAIQTSKRLPVPAELIEIANGGSTEGRAIDAWADVQKAACVSYMHDMDFQDRFVNVAIRLLGGRQTFFTRLGAGVDSEKWLRIEFMKAYARAANRPAGDEAGGILFGEADRSKVKGIEHTPRLVTIKSDVDRAKLAPPRVERSIEHQEIVTGLADSFRIEGSTTSA